MEILQKKRKDAEAREAAVAVDVEVEEVLFFGGEH